MSKTIFNEIQMKQLEKNKNVLKASERSISYCPDFKIRAVKENQQGKGPSQIFLENRFDLAVIGKKKPKQCLKRWRKTFEQFGEEGFYTERRGKGSTYCVFRSGIDIPKKVRRTRKTGVTEEALTPRETYALIEQTIRRFQFPRKVRYLCTLAGVSRSGYYAWLHQTDKHLEKERNDETDYEWIQEIFNRKGKICGGRSIKMVLEKTKGICMNLKRIYRIMRKYNLMTKIRRANPYKHIAKATQEHKTCPNLLKRQFNQEEPEKSMLTDITYLFYGQGKKAYLSCVKDSTTREILSYHVSSSLQMDIVYQTLDNLKERLGEVIHPEALLHSDQGIHYTHPEFQKRVREMGIRQSMSRRGNCLDNAPMESFFGHMKDELDYKYCQTFESLELNIKDYMEKYNYNRYQWTLKKMAPIEYRNHLLSA
ncbi:Putative transposase for insertion sequence element IS1353 [Bacillus cereus]|nr:Putative transposase for insertion sequence element IS1353 [Bacillus cereus]